MVRLLPDLRVLLVAVARSLPPLGSMAILTTLILFVYGMVGWLLFGDEDPGNWGNIGEAMLTLFVLLTLESFPQILEIAPAPVAERIAMLRAALQELEQELAAAMPGDERRS